MLTAEEVQVLSMLGMVFGIIMLVIVGISCAVKVIEMRYAKKCGARKYGLVWLPIGQEYVIGQLADQYEDKKSRKRLPILSAILYAILIAFFVFYFIMMFNLIIEDINNYGYSYGYDITDSGFLFAILMIFSLLLFVIAIIYSIYYYMTIYRLFCAKDRQNAPLWIILSIFAGGIPYIIFLCINMNKPVIPNSSYPQYYPYQPILNNQFIPPAAPPVQQTPSAQADEPPAEN